MVADGISKLYPEASPRRHRVENGDIRGSGDSQQAVRAAAAAHADWLRISAAPSLPGVGPDLRRTRAEIAAAVAKLIGVESQVRDLQALGRERYALLTRRAAERFDVTYVPIVPHVIDRGDLWWAHTDWWTPYEDHGIGAYFDDAKGGLSFYGEQAYDDGDLWKGSAGAAAFFGLGTDRMPAAGRYLSRPVGDLAGQVIGFTGVNGPFSFGDNWCKCWLHTDQTVRSASGATIVNSHACENVLFLENDGDLALASLPGTLFFPPVAFDLDPGQALSITLEVKLDLQFDGEATFRFGNYRGLVAALFRTQQWHLEPA